MGMVLLKDETHFELLEAKDKAKQKHPLQAITNNRVVSNALNCWKKRGYPLDK